MKKTIYVTEPSLPNLDELVPDLKKLWDSKWLTNNGQFHQKLEKELASYLGVKYVSLFTNGMLALQVGLQVLRITGEVITTPFSFVATTHAIHWNECTPVFCDIEPETCNIDPNKLESLITPKTTAIMPVHVYGNPCDTEALQRIADTYGLKIFYDAAHAFGVEISNDSILNSGDLSMLSFHATKVYNTFEGGALITSDPKLKERIDFLKNFGFAGETTVVAPGTNGKMDEFRSLIGLHQLKNIDNCIKKRQEISTLYESLLRGEPGIRVMQKHDDIKYNYSYFPVLVDESEYGLNRDQLYELLKKEGFYSRRYFYPLISQFPTYKNLPSAEQGKLPVAERISQEILCLPIYPDLPGELVEQIVGIIKKAPNMNM